MNPVKKVDDYTTLSLVYSHLMRSVNYKSWAKYIHSISKEHFKNKINVLELAAGEGKLAEHLQNYFKNIIISDISINMMKIRNHLTFQKVCCDMMFLPFSNKFDLIICAFDSINYLTSRNKIIKFFSEVRNVMNENSIFTFDASLLNNSTKGISSANTEGYTKGVYYKQVSTFNPESRIHKNEFIIKDKSGKTTKELHKQKIYDFDFYFDAAERSGLSVLECFEAFTFKEARFYNERVQFILRKNNSNAFIR